MIEKKQPKARPSDQTDRVTDLERQAKEAKDREVEAERQADKALERAERLEAKSKELGIAADEIRKKAAEPIGFPPPPEGKNERHER